MKTKLYSIRCSVLLFAALSFGSCNKQEVTPEESAAVDQLKTASSQDVSSLLTNHPEDQYPSYESFDAFYKTASDLKDKDEDYLNQWEKEQGFIYIHAAYLQKYCKG